MTQPSMTPAPKSDAFAAMVLIAVSVPLNLLVMERAGACLSYLSTMGFSGQFIINSRLFTAALFVALLFLGITWVFHKRARGRSLSAIGFLFYLNGLTTLLLLFMAVMPTIHFG